MKGTEMSEKYDIMRVNLYLDALRTGYEVRKYIQSGEYRVIIEGVSWEIPTNEDGSVGPRGVPAMVADLAMAFKYGESTEKLDPIVWMCGKYQVQHCSYCGHWDCCDNTNPVKPMGPLR